MAAGGDGRVTTGQAVVVGGGLAGLAAAYRLALGGWGVIVLEKEMEVGGRSRTAARGGFLFDTGAQHCRDSYDATLKTAIEVSLGERFRIPVEEKGVYHRGRVEHFVGRSANPLALLPRRTLGMKGLADVPSVALPLLRRYRSYNIKFPGWWKHGDLETAESFLSGRTSRDFRRALAEPVALFALGAELNKISAAGLMVAIRCVFADRSLGFTTGMGSLAAALAQKVEVLAGMEATEILTKDRTARGVRARPTNGGMARSYGADVVVCAVPAPQAAALCMDLSTEARSLLNETEYGTEVVVNLAFEGEARGVVGPVLLPRAEGFSAGWVCTNASKAYEYAPEGSSVVTVVFSGAQAPALLQKDDGTLVELALVEARRVYDLGGASAVLTRVDRHELARPVVSPGHADRVRWLMDKGSGFANLLLAGDWTSSPTVEGAVASGFRAAELAPAPIRGERMTEVNP